MTTVGGAPRFPRKSSTAERMGEVGGIAIIADSQGAGEFTAYPDALRFIIAVRDAGIHVAAASSSKNAGLFLRQSHLDTFAEENGLESDRMTLLEFFDADILGPRLRTEEAAS